MKEIKENLKEIERTLRNIKWQFDESNEYLAETYDLIREQNTNMIKDVNNFKRELKRDGLYSDKLEDFLENYMKYYNK